ncbi:MAG TPA: DUF3418 domain-containing protein, partial [Mycobacterium sp.]|nr:DUF3418 domain-containing protein [Mycobacterium sp.]
EWQTRHHFFRDNQRLRDELTEVEERARRRDLLVGDDEIYAFYDARIPPEAVSARHFDAWWKKQRHATPDLLTLTRDDLLRTESSDEHPDTWRSEDLALPLTYRFEPGAADDGVTVHVPVGVLARLGGDGFAWQVPALREELVTALIRSLPKDLRRNFVPAPDVARMVIPDIDESASGGGGLLVAVQRSLQRRSGILVPLDAFDLTKVPAHLRLTFAVESADGIELGRGKDLAVLQERLATRARQAVAGAASDGLQRAGLRAWPQDLDALPKVEEHSSAGHMVRGFPAFVDAGDGVNMEVFATVSEQAAAMRPGIRRLLRLAVPSPVKGVERQLDPRARLVLGNNPDGSLPALIEDCADAVVDAMVSEPVWTRAAFDALHGRVSAGLPTATRDILLRVETVLAVANEVQVSLPDKPSAAPAESITDIRTQLAALLPRGFVTATGAGHLNDLTRYLTAILRRVERLPRDIAGDLDRMDRVHAVQDAYRDLVAALSPARAAAPDVVDIARQIEDLRVSLWAQQLGTPRPVSEQRIFRAIDAIRP